LATAEATQRRRAVQDYAGQPKMLEEFSRLLNNAKGVTGVTAERLGHMLRAG